jgi:hypothetical protein
MCSRLFTLKERVRRLTGAGAEAAGAAGAAGASVGVGAEDEAIVRTPAQAACALAAF